MTREELFEKYSINERHGMWQQVDDWMSIEIFRLMHDGRMPFPEETTTKWVLEFLDKSKSDYQWWVQKVMVRNDWGSLFLTAKRMVFRYADLILKEVN